jgi:protein-S-isoprenylcysteine O-methyltransferase Ste14
MSHALELRVPPLAVVLIAALTMWALTAFVPQLAVALPWRSPVAIAFPLAGFMCALCGVIAFRRARTTVNPTTPKASSTVVTSGIYRWSRNPMYLGFLLALAGWAYYLSNPLAFIVLPAFVLYMNRFQIVPEERALTANFGAPYQAYKASVRRWL